MRQYLIGEQFEVVRLGETGERQLHHVESQRLDLGQVVPKLGRIAGEGRVLALQPVAGPPPGRRPVAIRAIRKANSTASIPVLKKLASL